MVFESWISPEETPALAEQARAVIDARLAHVGEAERAAFWSSIRKAYNTPYNPPVKAAKPVAVTPIAIPLPETDLPETDLPETDLPKLDLPVAAIAAAALAPEAHAA